MVRHCQKCGDRHDPPTEKKCQRQAASEDRDYARDDNAAVLETIQAIQTSLATVQRRLDRLEDKPADSTPATAAGQATSYFEQAIQGLRSRYEQTAKPNTSRSSYCTLYQSGSCSCNSDNLSQHGVQRHICGYCHRTKKGDFSHPEAECRRKVRKNTKDASKNYS